MSERRGGSGKVLAVAAVVLVPVVALLGLGGLLIFAAVAVITGGGSSSDAPASSSSCGAPSLQVSGSGEFGEVAGYSGEQLANAEQILHAGAALGVPQYGQTIGVMTAMGESSLRVVDYGDAAGPDSRGLFQQRANGAWGSYSDRMDPFTSATNFFKALLRVEGWEAMEPTIAAHETQRNADPYHYTRYWDAAVAVVASLTGQSSTDLAAPANLGGLAAIAPCQVAYSGVANSSGWSHPVPGFTTFWNNYGDDRGSYIHAGEDLAAPADTPILAAADGVVSHVSCSSWRGRSPCNILIDHGVDDQGRTVQTLYNHMYPEDVYVQVGQEVAAGEKIAGVGTNGRSTGNHLHFEVWIEGSPVDPQTFMAGVGIDLGDPTSTEVVNAPPAA